MASKKAQRRGRSPREREKEKEGVKGDSEKSQFDKQMGGSDRQAVPHR